jgi:hypothetical protein
MTTNKTSDSAFRITFSTSDSSPLDFDYTVNWLINAVLVDSESVAKAGWSNARERDHTSAVF